MIIKIVGRVVGIEAILMLLPLMVSVIYGEDFKCFLAAMVPALAITAVSSALSKNCNNKFYSKEGFVSVALSWLAISAIGAIPFAVSGQIPNYADALFETVSGFTTTGSSILSDIESLGRGILFWRSFAHWIGGMGILVFMMAVVPMSEEYSMYIMRAEVPGLDAGKLNARVQRSSMILYLIYIGLTLAEIIALLLCKMPLYDAVVHTFGTAGTGGFSVRNASIGAYNSAPIEIVIGIFMVLFGLNFNLFFFMLLGRFKSVFKNEELRCYLGVILFATVTIALNIKSMYGGIFKALRYSFFQVASIISTTGFSTTDFDLWPEYSKVILLLLMFFGGCVSSTAGGLKASRVIILIKTANTEIKHLLHPRSYNTVTLDKKPISKEILRGTLVYFLIYILVIAFSCVFISLENYDFITTFTSVTTCISNVGPGFGLVGPTCNFSFFSIPTKLLLSLCMLMGRLELFPILILLYPSTWKRRGQF